MALDVSDPMKPRIVRCNEECSSCGKSHCTRDYCLPSDLAELAKGKILDSNVPGGIIPPSKSQSATSNEGSSREGTRSSYEEQDPHSPLTTIESDEVSALSDAENSVIGRWSRTDVSLPSSASSSPSPRSPDAKNRNSTAVRPAENGGPREVLDPGKRASGVYEKRPQLHTEQEQSQHPGSAHEIQQPVARDMGGKEERGGGSEPAPYKLHISEDDVSSGQERPSPYVPMAPFGGPGGRRRPRRPQSKTV
ncbi:hypothetical protein F4801DRAFT_32036 [Xylaria longipes]|nr:hypothetical protein F4801DRAFT_32036 [Xylaria longipes]